MRREADGRPERDRTKDELPDPGPTPETLRRIAEDGPTCQIQKLRALKVLTNEEADAVQRFVRLLARAGVLGKSVQCGLREFIDGAGQGVEDDARAEAFRFLKRTVWPALDGEEIRHLGRVARQEGSANPGHVKNGARTLVKILIHGEKKAA